MLWKQPALKATRSESNPLWKQPALRATRTESNPLWEQPALRAIRSESNPLWKQPALKATHWIYSEFTFLSGWSVHCLYCAYSSIFLKNWTLLLYLAVEFLLLYAYTSLYIYTWLLLSAAVTISCLNWYRN
jgi:hypothetical protein